MTSSSTVLADTTSCGDDTNHSCSDDSSGSVYIDAASRHNDVASLSPSSCSQHPPDLQSSSSAVSSTSSSGGGGKETTTVCRDYLRNVCRRGDRCRFLHPADPTSARRDVIIASSSASHFYRPLVFCHDFQNATGCRRGSSCRFAHCSRDEEALYRRTGILPSHVQRKLALELAVTKSLLRGETPVCLDFIKAGGCRRANGKCRYRHVTADEFEREQLLASAINNTNNHHHHLHDIISGSHGTVQMDPTSSASSSSAAQAAAVDIPHLVDTNGGGALIRHGSTLVYRKRKLPVDSPPPPAAILNVCGATNRHVATPPLPHHVIGMTAPGCDMSAAFSCCSPLGPLVANGHWTNATVAAGTHQLRHQQLMPTAATYCRLVAIPTSAACFAQPTALAPAGVTMVSAGTGQPARLFAVLQPYIL